MSHPSDRTPPQLKPTTSTSLRLIRDSVAPRLGELSESVTPCHPEIEAAIRRCLPTDDYDKPSRLLFRLAREWKGLCTDDGCPIGVREFVRRWFDAGGQKLGESFDSVWLYFLSACESARLPSGMGPAELALQKAKENKMPTAAMRYDDERIRLLVAICHALQRHSDQPTFYLSCRLAGKLIGVPFKKASVFLCGLCCDGVLKEVAKGGITARGKLASRYRFVAPMD